MRVLENCMPLIQATLKSGIAHSPDFTLHDDQHGFRVAESMALIAEPIGIEKLGDHEIALLLLSAYCHDIGMTPGRDVSRRHYNFLLTAEPELLSPSEQDALQSWLDEERGGITPPLSKDPPTSSTLQQAEEISAYYGRHRHNDWSEDWIRAELSEIEPSLYPGWIDDLVTLCRSHHDGLTELRGSTFDARVVGNPGQPINLRFLAAILRLADVVEFDPERTPSVVLRSREIAPSSKIYWYKDHAISFAFSREHHRIILSARTPSAMIHRAVLSTADWVDAELATCCTLAQEGAFARGTIPEVDRETYSWPWPAKLTRDVVERDGRFTYIDGSFRPSTERILALLSGTALYGNVFAAVRELMQNSLDAVREQIAYERLQRDDPSNPKLSAALGQLHSVKLSFYSQDGRYWLECADTGVGMTREIIEKHLLVSGSDLRPETRALERNASLRGFSLDRTGQFGIGVLSYFMLADHIDFLTRRSQEAGDIDGRAWRFKSDGIGAFGELSAESRSSRGTSVRLRLKDVTQDNHSDWLARLLRYINSTVRWSPCRIEIRDDDTGTRLRLIEPGWAWSSDESNGQALESFDTSRDRHGEFVPPSEEQQIASMRAQWRSIRSDAGRALRWTDPVEVQMKDGAGIARISLPYFDLPGGASAAYLDAGEGATKPLPGPYHCASPSYQIRSSWRGFAVGRIDSNRLCAHVERDYRSGRTIKVDRAEFQDNVNTEDMDDAISNEIGKAWSKFLNDNKSSRYDAINRHLCPFYFRSAPKTSKQGLFWVAEATKEGPSSLERISFPLIDFARTSFLEDESKYKFSSDNEGDSFAGALLISRQRDARLMDRLSGGRIVVHNNSPTFSAMIGIRWDRLEDMTEIDGTWASYSCEFPEEWSGVLAVFSRNRPIINVSHRAFRDIAHLHFKAVRLSPEKLEFHIEEAIKSASDLMSFLISSLYSDTDIWETIIEKYKYFPKKVASILMIDDNEKALLYRSYGMYEDAKMIELSAEQIQIRKYRQYQTSGHTGEWMPMISEKRFVLDMLDAR